MEDELPPELVDGWEVYTAIQSGMVKPLTLDEWLKLPDDTVRQLQMIMEVMPQVIEAKRVTTASK